MKTTLADLGAIGVLADPSPQDAPPNAITRAQNIRFRDGYAERFKGISNADPLHQPAATPYWVQPYTTNTARYWIHTTLAGTYSDDGTTQANITGPAPTAGVDDRYTGGVLSGVLVVNNGKDIPQFWGGTGVLANLPGWGSNWRARSLRPFKNFLIGVGISKSSVQYQHMVKWSAAAAPGSIPSSWDEADPTLDAGEVDLAETQDTLVDQLPMGDVNILYKDSSMWAMRYVGAPDIFAFQRLPGDEVGLMARNCVVSTPVGHVLMTYGDVVVHSGSGAQSILNRKMRRWLRVRLSTQNFQRSFLAANRAANEVWICFPETGATACTLALVWNWVDNTLGVRDLANATFGASGRIPRSGASVTFDGLVGTFDQQVGAFDEDENNASETRLLLCMSPSALRLADQGISNNGAPFPALIERAGLAFGEPELVKTCCGLFLRVDAAAGSVLVVELGAAMTAEEAPSFAPPITYVVGESFKADGFVSGRFLAYRISSVDSFDWRIASLEFDIVASGRY